MIITHNIGAIYTSRQLNIVTDNKRQSMEKLSSGYRINRSADDAAGLSISEKMRSQIRGLDRASVNAEDGVSLVQTAEGALNEVHSILQRMNVLATQAANDTNVSEDRQAIAEEIDSLVSEIDRISSTTQFNTMNLLDGSFVGKNLQVGSEKEQNIELNIDAMNATALSLIIPGGVPASVNSSNPAITADITDESKVPDATLTYDTYYPYTPASIVSGDGNISLTAAGESFFTGSALQRYVFYAEAGTNYGTAPVKTIPVSGLYEFKAANGDRIINRGDLRNAASVSVNYYPTYLTYGYTPQNLSNIQIQDGSVSPTPVNGWRENGSPVSPSNYGINVHGTPSVGDILTLSSASDGKLRVDSFSQAGQSMQRIQSAIDKVSAQRAGLGAVQNRLEHTIANLDNASENVSAAESRIRDTDMAKEMVKLSVDNILSQAGQAMLSQGNRSMESVLSLLA